MSDLPPPAMLQPPPPLRPSRPSNDTVLLGCLMGFGTSVAFAVLGIVAALTVDTAGHGKLSDYLFVGWGVTQWIGIIPLILNDRSKGRHKRVKGLIIAGCIGVLLSSACASILLNLNIR
jgi:drug/metabolite transporter (DMT)-like permease